jgi:hypothetical protein
MYYQEHYMAKGLPCEPVFQFTKYLFASCDRKF